MSERVSLKQLLARGEVRRNVLVFTAYTVILLLISGLDLMPEHLLSHNHALMIQYTVYLVLIVLWAVSGQRRIMNQRVRKMHRLVVFGFVLILFLSRLRRVVFAGVYPWEHYLWYLFYLPNLGIPLLSYYMTLYVGRDDSYHIPQKAKLLLIPYAALVLAVLTNEAHELAFRLEDRGQAVSIAGRYHVSYIYYLTQVWLFGFALLALWRLYRVLKENNLRAYVLPPAIVMLIGLIYIVLYAFDRSPTGVGYIESNAMTCFSTLALWEMCIVMRLIPSNSGYGTFFHASTVPMEILDREGQVYFSSGAFEKPGTPEGEENAARFHTYITRTTEIPGGSVRYREDITRFREVISQLEKGTEELRISNEKLDAQNRMRLREQKAEERTRLYDEALAQTKEQLFSMRQILWIHAEEEKNGRAGDEQERDALAAMSVFGAYVKRRSNLVILSNRTQVLPLSELHFCLRESNEALVLVPVSTIYRNGADETLLLSVSEIMSLYDAFQAVIEDKLLEIDHLRMTLASDAQKVVLTLLYGGMGIKEETTVLTIPCEGRSA